jgi:hypothetical protein
MYCFQDYKQDLILIPAFYDESSAQNDLQILIISEILQTYPEHQNQV